MRLDHITVSVPETLSSDVYSIKHHDEFPGDHGEAETHVPIPNTTVKRFFADGTAACPWESRSLPGFFSPFSLLYAMFIIDFSLPILLRMVFLFISTNKYICIQIYISIFIL